MDYERANEVLRRYVRLVNETGQQARLSTKRTEVFPSLRMPARAVNRVLSSLAPDHNKVTGKTLADHEAALPLAEQALELINATQTMRTAERDYGGPVLPMALLDPLVRDAARRHWEAGHYRIAVGEAATNVDRYTQRRLERFDVSGAHLMSDAFSLNPPGPGKPRLRCPGGLDSEGVRSQQVGAFNYSQACFMAMRNPAHHQKGDWNSLTAFHFLVSLSQVATWVRHWDVERAPDHTPNTTSAAQALSTNSGPPS
jgi:hypothetical protein